MARTAGSSGEKTLARIRAEATALMARHGYDAVSMRDLGAACAIGAPALYRYFPTKQALLADLFASHFDAWEAGWAAAAGAVQGSHGARLDAYVAHGVRFQIERRLACELVAHEWRALERAELTKVVARRTAQDRTLREILRNGLAAGAFGAANVPLAATAIQQVIAGLALWHRPNGSAPVDAVIADHQGLARRIADVRVA
jgi:AcrR family transcriptional regulator